MDFNNSPEHVRASDFLLTRLHIISVILQQIGQNLFGDHCTAVRHLRQKAGRSVPDLRLEKTKNFKLGAMRFHKMIAHLTLHQLGRGALHLPKGRIMFTLLSRTVALDQIVAQPRRQARFLALDLDRNSVVDGVGGQLLKVQIV
jgi:hypothetical protein